MFGWRKPRERTLFIGDGEPIAVAAGETLLNAALRAGMDFPHSCKVGGCASCKCELVSGKVRELTDKAYLLSAEEIRANYILGCQSIPLTDVAIRLPVNPLANQRVEGVVIRQTVLTHDISEITIALEQPLRYLPGQYASVQALATDIPARCYSFARATGAEGAAEVSFFVRRIPGGRMSGWLSGPGAPGQRVRLHASLGDFHLRDGDGPLVCIAGGSGLAPVFAMLEGALETPAVRRAVVLLMGARAQRDLYYTAEISALQQRWQAPFRFVPVLSEEPAGSDWNGLRGWVNDAITTDVVHPGAQGYLCGPPPMIDACVAALVTCGIATENIHFDKFSDQSKGTGGR